eukprot:764489-Hanusia_phi.AAC.1
MTRIVRVSATTEEQAETAILNLNSANAALPSQPLPSGCCHFLGPGGTGPRRRGPARGPARAPAAGPRYSHESDHH